MIYINGLFVEFRHAVRFEYFEHDFREPLPRGTGPLSHRQYHGRIIITDKWGNPVVARGDVYHQQSPPIHSKDQDEIWAN